MDLFLRGLPPDCHFNIVSFGTKFSALWDESKPYDDHSLNEATAHVSSMQANMQETNLFDPLTVSVSLSC